MPATRLGNRPSTRRTTRWGSAAAAALLLTTGLGTAQAAPDGTRPEPSASASTPDSDPGSDSTTIVPAPTQQAPNHYGSSPFPPRETNDSRFVADESPGLDTGCTFRSGGPLSFDIEVDRVLADEERDLLVSNGLLSQFVSVRMPAYDVDYDAIVDPPYQPERDRVLFNGNVVQEEWLTGEDSVWKMNQFLVPVEWVEFAQDPGEGGTPEPAKNTITIEIDTANTDELWCTSIDWAELSFTMPRPTVFAHGILSDGGIWATPWAKELNDVGIYTDNSLNMGALDSIANNANKIGVVVEETRQRYGVDSVNMVVHSKGGLDSRHYVEDNDGVDRIVQLGTPNAGSPLADFAQSILIKIGGFGGGVIGALAAPAGVQLTTPYMYLYNQTHALSPQVDFSVMAGDYTANDPINKMLLLISGKGDTIVPLWSAHHFTQMLQYTYASAGANKDATHSGLHQSSAILALMSPTVQQPGRTTATPGLQATAEQAAGSTISTLPAHTVTVGGTLTGGSASHQVAVDTAGETFVSVYYTEGPALSVELVSPSGDRITPTTSGVEFADEEVEGARLAVYHLPDAEVGLWTVEVSGPAATTYAVHAWPTDSTVSLTMDLPDPSVAAGEVVPVLATLTNGADPLTGAEVSATVRQPDGTSADIALTDDGTGSDVSAGDGIYSGGVPTSQVGMYAVNVAAEGTTDGVAFSRETFGLATASSGAATLANISDSGEDLNGNGMYDALRVSFDLDVEAAGTYRVFGELTDSEGNSQTASTVVTVPVGVSPVAIAFDGATIYDAGVDGPYTVSMLRVTEESDLGLMPVTELSNAHTSAGYAYGEFEHAGLHLTGNGTAEGVDLDGNGLFDQLRVTVEVNTDTAGYYQWSGQLRSPAGTELEFESGAANFAVGTNDLVFTFEGLPIGASGEDGPYRVTDVLAYGSGLSLVAGDAFQTQMFTASQFEGYVGEVERIAGADRYETAALIAQTGTEDNAGVFVASGELFPDALAVSAAAGAAPGPLLLTRGSAVPAATSDELLRRVAADGPQAVTVAGGSNVVRPTVISALTALAGTDTEVLAGPDRYATAATIAAATVDEGATAYVVSGLVYPDALTAATLAAPEDGSVLLTRPAALPAATISQLVAQKPGRIVVVGGPDSVSEDVLTSLGDFAPVVERIAGANRYETAAAVADSFDAGVDVLYVATGENYPDALTVAALAGQQSAPVLLTTGSELSVAAAQAADRLEPDRIVVVGGTSSVSEQVQEELRAYLK